MTGRQQTRRIVGGLAGFTLCAVFTLTARPAAAQGFRIEEASIADIHAAIKAKQTTCEAVVQAYIARARAYNGACTVLVTKDGAPVSPATGSVRAGNPVKFPTQTLPLSKYFPDLDKYEGKPFELGRMEPTRSDPTVMQQVGMRAGVPNAGQLNALETINIRGERSVTCKGEFDRHPSQGPLPAGAPAVCEEFRKQPDALERAAELDKQYGANPDLAKLPMYCVVFSFKNWYDAKDMRGSGGNDVDFAMDVPKYDSPDVGDLRSKGAIIYAVATADNVGGASARGPKSASTYMPFGNLKYAQWGGQPCNPYDTEREPRGTSGGSGVSVAANLVTCSICEQGSASCKGPASRNNVVNLLTTKGVMMDGGIGSKNAGDRAGLHCRTVRDAVTVLDAIKGYEKNDMFTAIPKGLIPSEPYAASLVTDKQVGLKPLKGMRIAIAREFMVKHTKNDVAISDLIDKEVKAVLRDKLGAELVETVDPLYTDDPTVPNVKYTFQQAMAEILPHNVPEYFWQKAGGQLEFAVPGWDVTTTDYMLALATGKAPLSPNLNIRRISQRLGNPSSTYTIDKYLAERGDAKIKTWADWVTNTKFESDEHRVASENAVGDKDPRPAPGSIPYLQMQSVLRMIVLKVMQENGIDAFVNPEQTTPPYILGGPGEPEINGRPQISCCTAFTALLGGPEMDVPAGYATTVYNQKYQLAADRQSYVEVTGDVESKLTNPMPISMMVWSGPGSDASVIKVASAYEAATHYRKPPAAFGPVPAKSLPARVITAAAK